jgi:hypothetical protein
MMIELTKVWHFISRILLLFFYYKKSQGVSLFFFAETSDQVDNEYSFVSFAKLGIDDKML